MSNGTFNIKPVLRQSDLMWFHKRMRGGQQIFEFAGLDHTRAVKGYELAIWQRSDGFLVLKFRRRGQPECLLFYYRGRADGDWQWLRGEEYPVTVMDTETFFDLMGQLSTEEITTGEWRS